MRRRRERHRREMDAAFRAGYVKGRADAEEAQRYRAIAEARHDLADGEWIGDVVIPPYLTDPLYDEWIGDVVIPPYLTDPLYDEEERRGT